MQMEKKISRTMANARVTYMLELARASLYISSTLTPETRQRAMTEVLGEIRELYGNKELAVFRELLVEDLKRRGKSEAARAVLGFKPVK
jgi:hypothetical protein